MKEQLNRAFVDTSGNPIKAALENLRRAQYAEAANLLRCEFDKSPRTREHLARIANMITPCGMIAEAIDALQRLDGGIEDYYAHPPADEDIGSRVSITTPNAPHEPCGTDDVKKSGASTK